MKCEIVVYRLDTQCPVSYANMLSLEGIFYGYSDQDARRRVRQNRSGRWVEFVNGGRCFFERAWIRPTDHGRDRASCPSCGFLSPPCFCIRSIVLFAVARSRWAGVSPQGQVATSKTRTSRVRFSEADAGGRRRVLDNILTIYGACHDTCLDQLLGAVRPETANMCAGSHTGAHIRTHLYFSTSTTAANLHWV